MNGILIVDKPRGWTSFDVIAKLRKKLGQKKIGHMGTLDPLATGVLPVLLGDTAKFQIFVNDNNKVYETILKFGVTTDSLDITGEVTSRVKSKVAQEDLQDVCNRFLGEIYQIPPMYSAIKKDGIKLCDLARKGIEIEREKRRIFIYGIKIKKFDFENQETTINVECSKGTYIRTLVDDIGKELGCGATVLELRRTCSNGFCEEKAATLQEILDIDLDKLVQKYILPTEELFKGFPIVEITEAQAVRFKNGGTLDLERIKLGNTPQNTARYKVYCGGIFLGLGEVNIKNNELKVLKCLR